MPSPILYAHQIKIEALMNFAHKVAPVIAEVGRYFQSAHEGQALIDRDELIAYRLMDSEELGSLIVFQDVGEAIEILLTATDPAYQRRGYMRLLLIQLKRAFVGRALWLEVSETNHGALKLYLEQGFVQVGLRPNYYPSGESALLLTFEPC